jgi:hypothetical protein
VFPTFADKFEVSQARDVLQADSTDRFTLNGSSEAILTAQIQYLAQCGLPIAANKAHLPIV